MKCMFLRCAQSGRKYIYDKLCRADISIINKKMELYVDGICYPSLLVLLGFTIRLLHILIYFLYICNVIIHLVGNNRKLVINCTGFEHKLCFAQTLSTDCKFTNLDEKVVDQLLDNLVNSRSYSGNYTYTLPNFPFLK
jgi:hypothetical protein